jgi:hypothetical protein
MRREHPHAAVGLRDLTGLVSTAWRRSKGAGPPDRFWDPAALAGFAMTLPARVTVSLRSGRSLVAEVLVPRGAPGHPTALPGQVAAEKLRTWGPRLWGSAVTEKIEAAIAADAGDLYALLGSP